MSLRQSFRSLIHRSFSTSRVRSKRGRRPPTRFERLEGRALLTGVSGDFNGDGFDDLAIGSPLDNVSGKDNAGSVQVLYGSPSGLTAEGNRRLTLNSTGLEGDGAVGGERFGAALAVGDFDGDGFDDLAIGAPNEIVNGMNSGALHILYGSRFGLRVVGDQVFHQATAGINGHVGDGDKFGAALAAGDFDNDGRDDLAIGVPGKEVGGLDNAGAVNIIYGRNSGLSAIGDQQFHQNTFGVDGVAQADDEFGFALAVGDFNGNGRDDLAIGIIGEDVVGINMVLKVDAGAVYIMYGSGASGLSVSGDQYRHAAQDGVQGTANPDGEFGYALAAGDFNDDSRDDLAVGAPGEEQTVANSNATRFTTGAVHVFMGGSNGTVITGDQKWDKGVPGIAETPTDTDQFGSALTVGQINRNRQDDLIIGIPGNTISSTAGAGSIRVLFGSANGLTANGTASLNQSSATGLGTLEANDNFGSALAIGDYNGDLLMDVAVGVPGDQTDDDIKSGSVNVFYATANTLGTAGAQLWLPGEGGLTNSPDDGDMFGGALS